MVYALSIPASLIKKYFNGLTKKLFLSVLQNNSVDLTLMNGQTHEQYLDSIQVQTAIKNSNEFHQATIKYKKKIYITAYRQALRDPKILESARIKINDRLGYNKQVVIPISKFSDYESFRVVYNQQDQSNIKLMYDNLVDFKKEHIGDKNKLQGMVFYIKNKNEKEMRCISVKTRATETKNFEAFSKLIDDMMTEENDQDVGSDQVRPQDEYIDFSRFDAFVKSNLFLGGLDSIKLFKTVGINGGNSGLCVYYCLQRFLGENFMTPKEFKKKSLDELEALAEWIKDNNHQINLILTIPKLTKELFNMSEENEVTVKIGKFTTDLYRASIENATYIYPYGCFFPDSDRTIFIDIDGKHADLPLDNIVQMNEFLFAESGNYYMKNENEEYEKIKYSEDQLYAEGRRITRDEKGEYIVNDKPQLNGLIPATNIEHNYIFYDYKTVIDFSCDNPIIPVSLSFVEVSRDEFNMLNGNFIDNLQKIKSRVSIYHGRNCTKFLNTYICESVDKIFTLVSFNGARFNHHILYNEMSRQDFLDHQEISDVFFLKNDLLNFKMEGRHDLFDLRKHIKLTLEDACKKYKIDSSIAKKKIDFFEIQQLYDTLGTEQFIQHINNTETEQGRSYNEYITCGIISIIAVMYRYYESINKILKIDDITKYKTNIQMMTDILDKNLYKLKIKLPLFKKKQLSLYNDLERSQVYGKAGLANGIQKLFGQIFPVNCSGMCQFVMSVLDVYYPCGKIVEIDSYNKLPKDAIGFFYCSGINQSHLIVKIHPKKINNNNDWHTTDIIDNVLLSTIRINMLKREGCPITIKNGFYFTKRAKSCDMFSFILDFMKIKTEQDNFKKNKDPKYNELLRKTAKELMLNCEMAEGLCLNNLIVVDEWTYNNQYRFNDKADVLSILYNGNALVKLEVSEDNALRHSKPIYIGTLIYDYAQEYMRTILLNNQTHKHALYLDIDSTKMTKNAFAIWSAWALTQPLPHWPEVERYDPRYKIAKLNAPTNQHKVIGSFVDE